MACPRSWSAQRVESIQRTTLTPRRSAARRSQPPGGFLERDGSNLASTIETTGEVEEWAIKRAGRYLVRNHEYGRVAA